MNEPTSEKPIRYCYECGNRLRTNLEHCWYCGVPIRRQIRPPRRCPFCAEQIRPESIKCPHCGEFVDGREKVMPQPVQQMIVIDKELLNAMQDLRLLPGSPVPDTARRVLPERTVRAIEAGTTDQIQQPGVRVLPAPPDALLQIEYKPVETGAVETTGSSEIILRPMAQPPAPATPGAGPPAKTALPPSHPLASLARAPVAPLARRKAPPPAKPAPAKAEKADAVVDAELSDVYRICDACKTEILAKDNYCYYCGRKFRRTYADERRAAAERRRRFFKALWTLVLLAIVAAVGVGGYLYLKGFVSRENLKDLGQIGRDALKGNLPKNLEELKTLDPKAIAAAAQCRRNLTLLASAKRAIAEAKGLKEGTVALEDVLKQLQTDRLPTCPTSGTYTLNPIGQPPTCSIGDNGTTSTLDDHVITDK